MDNNNGKRKLNTFGKISVLAYIIGSVILMATEKYCLLGSILLIALYVFCQGGIEATIKKWQADELLLEPGEETKKKEEER